LRIRQSLIGRRILFVKRNSEKRILMQLATGTGGFNPRVRTVNPAEDIFVMRTGMTIHKWTPLKGDKVRTGNGRQRTAVSGSKDWKSSDT